MADEKKQPEFTVTDRRRFTSEGEATAESGREPVPEPTVESAPPEVPQTAEPPVQEPTQAAEPAPPPPSAAEREAQRNAFDASKKQFDAQLESRVGGRRAQDFEMSFERFIASLYMSSLLQLGLMHEQGGAAQVDLLGARQTIDTLAILAEKTKGNLTAAEDNLLQNCLYELRMAYVEVTNALARPPQAGEPTGKK